MLDSSFLFIGAVFSVLAGVVAFLISYNENRHRFEGRRLWKETLATGGMTFLFFLFISLVLAVGLPSLM